VALAAADVDLACERRAETTTFTMMTAAMIGSTISSGAW
jgi:hypothetical protein